MRKYCIVILWLLGSCGMLAGQSLESTEPDLKARRECTQNIRAWLNVPELRRSPGLMEDLADCYAKTEDHAAAAKWYAESIGHGNAHADIYRKYAYSLRAENRYDEAMASMRQYADIVGQSSEATAFYAECETLRKERLAGGRFVVERMGKLGSRQSEIVACRHGNEIYFYSRAPRRQLGNVNYKGSNTRPFSLYKVPESVLADRRNVRTVARNSCERETNLGLVWDQSCSDYYLVKSERNAGGSLPPAIYRSWLDRNGLVQEEKLLLNSSVAARNFHPAVSPNGRILVFVSDREGGIGGTDLYFCTRDRDTWSEPQNLGALVNTVQDESYPSFSADGKLYFSTEGYHGFGKRDIYYSQLVQGEWTAAINVGAAINSDQDDFALVWNPASEGHSGYFTTNRDDGLKDEIYQFVRYPEVVGYVLDAATGKPLPQAEVALTMESGEGMGLWIGKRGEYSAFITPDHKYFLEASAPGYESKSWEFNANDIPQGGDLHFDIQLDPARSYTLQGAISNAVNGEPLDRVSLRIVNGQTGEVLRYDGSIGSTYSITLEAGADYALLFQREGYNSIALQLPLREFQGRKVEQRDLQFKPGDQILLVGTVTDAQGQRMQGISKIDVVHMKTKALWASTETEPDGSFSICVDRKMVGQYALFASRGGVQAAHVNVIATDDQYFPISLVPAKFSLEFASNALYYDFGKREIEAFSRETLDDVYFFMLRNPDVHMELRTYCDARGDSLANIALARQRSTAIINDLLVRGGLTPDRLHHVDYGESRPLNECVDGVECPEEKHAVNRRTEVYFYKPDHAIR